MEITCPSCNKVNETSPCQRCGGELGPLFAIREAADAHLKLAGEFLREGSIGNAYHHAAHSWSLHHSPDAAKIAFLSCAYEKDPAAWQWLGRGMNLKKSGGM